LGLREYNKKYIDELSIKNCEAVNLMNMYWTKIKNFFIQKYSFAHVFLDKTKIYLINKKNSLFKSFRYHFLLSRWTWLKQWRRILRFTIKYSNVIKRLAIIISASIFSFLFWKFNLVSDLKDGMLSNWLIALGTLSGGVIAILFSLMIFAQQNGAALYSSSNLNLNIDSWKERLIYFLISVITLGFFVLGILTGQNNRICANLQQWLIYLSFHLLAVVIILIEWQHTITIKKTNPTEIFKFIEKSTVKFLDSIQKDAGRMVKIIQSQEEGKSEKELKAAIYNNIYLKQFNLLNNQIDSIFEILLKLSNKGEFIVANSGLLVIHNIIIKYFSIKVDCSVVLLSKYTFFAYESDSQSFLSKVLERLNESGQIFIKENRVRNSSYVVDIFKSLLTQSRIIEFLGNRQGENPIFDLIRGYLSQYADFAIREKDLEVVFQISQILDTLSEAAISKNLTTSFGCLQDDIKKIAIYGIANDKSFITEKCISALLNSLVNIFKYKSNNALHQIGEILKNITEITENYFVFVKAGYTTNDFFKKLTISKGFDEMPMVLGRIFTYYNSLTEEQDKNYFERNLIEFFDELYHNLRKLSEDIKECDSYIISSVSQLIFTVNDLIIQLLVIDRFGNYKEELNKWLGFYIHLPPWFVINSEKITFSNSFRTLSDNIAKNGLQLLQNSIDDDLILDCVDSIYSIAEHSLSKEKRNNYDEPRIMMYLCYLGIMALKLKKDNILTEIGLKIYDFEIKYWEKYKKDREGLPKFIDPETVIGLANKDQLKHDVFSWRYDFARDKYNHSAIMNDAEDDMFRLIDELDIDRFLFEIWHSFPSRSEFGQEIEEKYKRRFLLIKLLSCLKFKIFQIY